MADRITERPILFSAPMVRAILAGKKTQTRRVISGHPGGDWVHDGFGRITSKHPRQGRFGLFVRRGLGTDFPEFDIVPCPYGQPGDRLWVREKFQPLLAEGVEHWKANWETGEGYAISYPATDGIVEYVDADDNLRDACKPSIHMPRWASRITLEITAVRVERLQDIWGNDEDCIAEGIEEMPANPCGTRFWRNYLVGHQQAWSSSLATPGNSFSTLWRSINGDESWDANPWVWVVEFKRLEGGAA